MKNDKNAPILAPRLTRETILETIVASVLLFSPYSFWKDMSCVIEAAEPSSHPVNSQNMS